MTEPMFDGTIKSLLALVELFGFDALASADGGYPIARLLVGQYPAIQQLATFPPESQDEVAQAVIESLTDLCSRPTHPDQPNPHDHAVFAFLVALEMMGSNRVDEAVSIVERDLRNGQWALRFVSERRR